MHFKYSESPINDEFIVKNFKVCLLKHLCIFLIEKTTKLTK